MAMAGPPIRAGSAPSCGRAVTTAVRIEVGSAHQHLLLHHFGLNLPCQLALPMHLFSGAELDEVRIL